jgi:hypothetical protein
MMEEWIWVGVVGVEGGRWVLGGGRWTGGGGGMGSEKGDGVSFVGWGGI